MSILPRAEGKISTRRGDLVLGSAPRLSICIPTYNRAAFIGETLASIADQVTSEVEVVVSDNASSDDTAAVVESFHKRLPRLIYSKSESNEGFSRNFMRAVSLASGDYCVLLGSDDVICDGMLRRILDELMSRQCVYLFDRFEWDAVKNTRTLDPVLETAERRETFRLGDRKDLLHYLHSARSITGMFSFISSVVFNRNAWNAVPVHESWHECGFPHAMRIFGMFTGDSTLRCVRAASVLSRLDNDTFNPGGHETIRRLLMDYDGYERIIEQYWGGDGVLAAEAKAVMRRTHPTADIFKFRRIVRPDQLTTLCKSLATFEYGRIFVWFYGTEVCRLLVVGLKRVFQMIGRPTTTAAHRTA